MSGVGSHPLTSILYSSLNVSLPRAAANSDAFTTLPAEHEREELTEPRSPLAPHLTRLQSIQTSLQQALSHALASCAASPSSRTGILRNVVNHISFSEYTGPSTKFTVEDLQRLCWLWEWDGKTMRDLAQEDDNPFLEAPPLSKDWTRGSMGFVVSSATQISKVGRNRLPAYGIGIKVEIHLDNNMGARMAMTTVARWIAATETRRKIFSEKLQVWTKMHANLAAVPMIPLADLPILCSPLKPASLARAFASMSPQSSSSSSKKSMPMMPSPSQSSSTSPTKEDLAIPASIISTSPGKGILCSYTPSDTPRILNIRTPTSFEVSTDHLPSEPFTPRGRNPDSVLQTPTPTASRRQALYDRIQQRSMSASPSKSRCNADVPGSELTKDQMLKFGRKEMRRRCLLGRLGGVAESVWMLFSCQTTGRTSTSTSCRGRTLLWPEVASSIVKSSPVTISIAEANESLELLIRLCPFFLQRVPIDDEEWLGMPSSLPSVPASPSKQPLVTQELAVTSPRRIKRETGGLREVREIIRRELGRHD
ncbi:hypothetical protein BT96DRAFT_1025317 [Gymnopus androsaceus JB14]|uniref:DNA replication factor Cdt1 C-terminal domain-containing protein n=1 Tax=Gymnopus androsaceus JB14 TaxID=1447944 RepID=A0A6A4GSE7_9AGAR|nr:hypothetical protein BT96DRAFT_1025317 [Gymnopus androsaceus JB14]